MPVDLHWMRLPAALSNVRGLALAACLCCGGLSQALAKEGIAVDAGSLQQQIERNQVQRLPRMVSPEAPLGRAIAAPEGALVVTVSRFVFKGNTLLTESQLNQIVAGKSECPCLSVHLTHWSPK